MADEKIVSLDDIMEHETLEAPKEEKKITKNTIITPDMVKPSSGPTPIWFNIRKTEFIWSIRSSSK